MKLRDYQTELINQVRKSYSCGHKKILSILPCGGGKTVCFAFMCMSHLQKNPNGYIWFLVHRQELIEQTIRTFDSNEISRDRVLIGMVQTVSRRLADYPKPSIIIFDEAHHATAGTWLKITDYYKNVPIIGLTATPCRLDGRGLGSIFSDMQIGVSANWLIENHYLSEYDYYAPKINFDEALWQVKGSDYDMQSVSESFEKAKIYGDVLKYIDLNKKIIIYSPSIEFSKRLEDTINQKYGDICKHFDGETPKLERQQIISDFRSGALKVLTNVNLIGEGFDVPDCDCCILLRPTMSVALYIQQACRCLRYQPGKKAVIYDLVGNVYKHGMPTDDREWSLTNSIKIRNKSGDKDVLVRTCQSCYRIYAGTGSKCPYCGFENGKTKKQIEIEEKAELEKIEKLEKRQKKFEFWSCKTFEDLVTYGRKQGYKNPVYWANTILAARANKKK